MTGPDALPRSLPAKSMPPLCNSAPLGYLPRVEPKGTI